MRKEKKRIGRFILPIFVVVIFVGSMFGVMIGGIGDREDIVNYNGFIFRENSDGFFSFKSDGKVYNVKNLPSDVKDVLEDIPIFLFGDLGRASKVYITKGGGNVEGALYNLYFNLRNNKNVVLSCLPENADDEECKDIPLKNCDDAGKGVLVFIVNEGDNKNLEYIESCFVLKGGNDYLEDIFDAIIFKYLGVFNGE